MYRFISPSRFDPITVSTSSAITPYNLHYTCTKLFIQGDNLARDAKCGDYSGTTNHGLCQYTGCFTERGDACAFPFRYTSAGLLRFCVFKGPGNFNRSLLYEL